jgi:hypothetical protein
MTEEAAAQQTAYEVYLATDAETELPVDSPVETTAIDYYDSGIWLTLAEGRAFFPYAQLRMIRERPGSTTAAEAVESDALESATSEQELE